MNYCFFCNKSEKEVLIQYYKNPNVGSKIVGFGICDFCMGHMKEFLTKEVSMTTEVTLASALLRRKELNEKVKRLEKINVRDLYEIRAQRVKVTDNIDDLTANVPKIAFQQFTACYDYYAKALRQVDLVIQQANHTTKVIVPPNTMEDFVDPYVEEGEKKSE